MLVRAQVVERQTRCLEGAVPYGRVSSNLTLGTSNLFRGGAVAKW
jgi:hypothetical protein